MHAKKLLSLLFVFLACSAFSQENYLFEKFVVGNIYKKNTITPATLNYNLFTSNMVVKDGSKLKTLEKINEIDYIAVGNEKFMPLDDYSFGKVIIDGGLTLLLKYSGNVVKTDNSVKNISKTALNKLLNSENPIPVGITIEKDSVFYFCKERKSNKFYFPGTNIEKATHAGIIKLFTKNKAEIEEYIKENNIDFSSVRSLIKLTNFCEDFTD